MGLPASPTTGAYCNGALLEPYRLVGAEGQGLSIAFGALDCGRPGIAAVATGLAQAVLDVATD